MRLILVESPTKSRTLKSFLGRTYEVAATMGHVRDLPKDKIGVDLRRDFKPTYVIPPKAKKVIQNLKKLVQDADTLILATDGDREGEAIAWHIVHALDLNERKTKSKKQKVIQRIVFHEITKRAIEKALVHPRVIDIHLVDAQQARRILDRLVGYKLSPFLWRKVARGLSAGRVQSVAVRLIVEREREIENFIREEYWTIVATLSKQEDSAGNIFEATLTKIDGETLSKLAIGSGARADEILAHLNGRIYRVAKVEKREVEKYPLPPYTTSTLQQDAWRRLRFSSKTTMRTAQGLYEGIHLGKKPVGLITYMRTDSVHIAKDAQFAAKEYIERTFGPTYHAWRTFKTKSRLAQEAHEAIRPTDPERTPESVKPHLDLYQQKLYTLIWQRFIACQMAPARYDATAVEIEAEARGESTKRYTFSALGQTLKFDGFLRVYTMKFEETDLPGLSESEVLTLRDLTPQQHFTKPPPRYTEATLVKKLEHEGIGRPSTYAPIMSTIEERGYVEKDERRSFRPTKMGMRVNDLLVAHFPAVVDPGFTAKMEEEFDEIAEGKREWVPVIRAFYEPFAKNLKEKYVTVSKQEVMPVIPTDEICEKCGEPMVIRLGRFGEFLACSGFPKCKNTKTIEKSTGIICPKCNKGEIVQKRTKRKKLFYGCNQFPSCDFALWQKPTGEKCPQCGSLLIEERGVTCANKECGWVKNPPPQH